MESLRDEEGFDDKMRSVTPTDTEVNDRLLNEDDAEWIYRSAKLRPRYGLWWTIGIVLLTTGLSGLAGIFVGYRSRDLDEVCSRYVSHYSPVLSNVPIKYHTQRFNGSLLKENIFRQDAGPEVDAAWEALGVDYRPIRVPADEAARSGMAHDQVQIREEYGGGYPANVEGLHHLHCPNLLRQSLYYNYEYYHAQGKGAFKNDNFVVRKHVSHCLDILRQQLMCTIDKGVLGQVSLYPDHPSPFVDFNTEHRCRNFEDVRIWAERNQLPERTPGDFLRPPGKGDRVFEGVP
ncbi:hypothetical protein BJX66DRAFT_88740 [Aspergillus keveii]|uniref:Tat pathway signal sequence n=1 Tax=Aspergillus keveii TaxID=714993 RepID=A0ABR4FM80_9EURO